MITYSLTRRNPKHREASVSTLDHKRNILSDLRLGGGRRRDLFGCRVSQLFEQNFLRRSAPKGEWMISIRPTACAKRRLGAIPSGGLTAACRQFEHFFSGASRRRDFYVTKPRVNAARLLCRARVHFCGVSAMVPTNDSERRHVLRDRGC